MRIPRVEVACDICNDIIKEDYIFFLVDEDVTCLDICCDCICEYIMERGTEKPFTITSKDNIKG